MKKTLLLVASALTIGGHASAINIDYNSTYTQSFDSLPSTNTASVFSTTIGAQVAIPGTDVAGWVGTKLSGTGTSAVSFIANDGSGNTGALYSYAAAATPTDRALGSLASGGFIGGFGASFVNTSSLTLDTITLTFDGQAYRSSTSAVNKLTFAYGLSGGTITDANFLTSTAMSADATGDISGPPAVATNAALVPPVTTAITVTLTGINWTPGSTLYLRWSDANEAGNDAGLAINNFSLVAVPEPHEYGIAFAGLLGLLVVARRRHEWRAMA